MNQVKQLHGHALRRGLDLTLLLVSKLLELPDLVYASRLLDSAAVSPPPFLYNKLLQSCSAHGLHSQGISLFFSMLRRGTTPNRHSFTFLFSSCASVPSPAAGISAHAHLLKLGIPMDAFVSTSLLDMYAKSGLQGDARRVFDEMPDRDLPAWNSIIGGYARAGDLTEARKLFEVMPARNVISWTTMVSGYSQNCQYEEAIAAFKRMWFESEVKPNEVTVASVLPACANLCALHLGKKVEIYARENNLTKNLFVSNALLEMYAKCGHIERAREMFDEMRERRNLCSWNTMIMGLAVHGGWNEALDLFNQMLETRVHPDDITFVGVLLACTHGGLVDQGRTLFDSMVDFSLSPKLQHYGCMVDLLGRAGHLSEAFALIQSMPMTPDSVIWGALLGACSFHGQTELAETAASFLSHLEPWNPGNYVILSNIYASSGWWDGVAKTWKKLKMVQRKKAAGWSSIEVNGCLQKFVAGDESHSMFKEIYASVDRLLMHMRSQTGGDPGDEMEALEREF